MIVVLTNTSYSPSMKAHHDVLQLHGVHLAVTHAHPHIWAKATDEARHLCDVLDAIVDEEHLTTTAHLVLDRIADQLLVEAVQLGDHRMAVGRRCAEHREVAGTHKRELQRARDGRGRQRQRVHVGLHLFQLVLDGHSEFLFFVNNEQAEVEELHVLAHNAVRADEDVHLAIGQAFQRIVLLLGGLETVDVIHLGTETLSTGRGMCGHVAARGWW
jgi:hypothetical protein